MTDHHQPAANDGPDGATEPAEATPAAASAAAGPTVSTEPIAPIQPPAARQVAQPAPTEPAARGGVRVQRSWLVAGAGVGALALVGLGFGLGYITGDQVGGHGDRPAKHVRGEMRGFPGQMPGGEMGRGQRWLVVPPNLPGRNGQLPDRQPDQQSPETTAPSAEAPS